jgi:hypothetical protein
MSAMGFASLYPSYRGVWAAYFPFARILSIRFASTAQ